MECGRNGAFNFDVSKLGHKFNVYMGTGGKVWNSPEEELRPLKSSVVTNMLLGNKGFITLIMRNEWQTTLSCHHPLEIISAPENCLAKGTPLSQEGQHPMTDRPTKAWLSFLGGKQLQKTIPTPEPPEE